MVQSPRWPWFCDLQFFAVLLLRSFAAVYLKSKRQQAKRNRWNNLIATSRKYFRATDCGFDPISYPESSGFLVSEWGPGETLRKRKTSSVKQWKPVTGQAIKKFNIFPILQSLSWRTPVSLFLYISDLRYLRPRWVITLWAVRSALHLVFRLIQKYCWSWSTKDPASLRCCLSSGPCLFKRFLQPYLCHKGRQFIVTKF